MTELLPLLLAASLGFRHAFEADHLVAVSNIVTKRNSIAMAMKDGTSWGLGHSASILLIGIFMLLLRQSIPAQYFRAIEGAVGIMIIVLGLFRLWQIAKKSAIKVHSHVHHHDEKDHKHVHMHTSSQERHSHFHKHKVSFGVGIVHGLAGSGVLVAAVMTTMKSAANGLLFLLIFSIGCIAGMMLAAGALSLPFSKKLNSFVSVQQILVVTSCLICLFLGGKIVLENWL